jgi:hypothetical protein
MEKLYFFRIEDFMDMVIYSFEKVKSCHRTVHSPLEGSNVTGQQSTSSTILSSIPLPPSTSGYLLLSVLRLVEETLWLSAERRTLMRGKNMCDWYSRYDWQLGLGFLGQGVEINLRLPCPKKNTRQRVGLYLNTYLARLWHVSFRQHEIILHDEVTKHNLELVGSEEASRACVPAVPKGEMVRACTNEMGLVRFGRLLSHEYKAVRVKLFRILEKGRIHHPIGGNQRPLTFVKDRPIGEFDIAKNHPPHVDYRSDWSDISSLF